MKGEEILRAVIIKRFVYDETQSLLGHASLNTTQVYTAVAITDLKEAHAKCHPRESDRE